MSDACFSKGRVSFDICVELEHGIADDPKRTFLRSGGANNLFANWPKIDLKRTSPGAGIGLDARGSTRLSVAGRMYFRHGAIP